MRWFLVLMLVGGSLTGGLTGCAQAQIKRLSETEFKHFYALRPFMDEDQRKAYLKLKTEEERNQWLKDEGFWEVFYKYSERERQAIVDGAVAPGWKQEMVYMAWGAPFDTQKMPGRPATRSELLVYRFEVHEDGSLIVWEPGSKTEYKAVDFLTREVYVDDGIVAEIKEKKGWR